MNTTERAAVKDAAEKFLHGQQQRDMLGLITDLEATEAQLTATNWDKSTQYRDELEAIAAYLKA